MSNLASLKVYAFKVNAGVSVDELLKADEGMSEWIKKQDGFQYRSLANQADGSWLDVVYWANTAAEKAASEKFMAENADCPFMELIDQDSLDMQQYDVQMSSMAG